MSLPGGPADKFGNRYETWWTACQLVRILKGDADSIRIEEPGVDKAEFAIESGGQRELHQARRSHQSGKWSLSSLTDVLQGMFDQLKGNDARFVFVSGSDAPELRELSERSRQALSLEEFESVFVDTENQKENFDKLRKIWRNSDAATARDMLKRIEVQTLDERNIIEKAEDGLHVVLLQNLSTARDALRAIAVDFIHQIITRDGLVVVLKQRGCNLRRLSNSAAAPELVRAVTDHYLESGRKKLIRNSLIPRVATKALVERIEAASRGSDFVLTGKAGVGKTAFILELVDRLREKNVPVLAFRLDRLTPVLTTAQLGQQLELEESPTLVLASAVREGQAVLVIDQLDAVSTTSGRSSEFFETIDALMSEARGLRERIKLHLVLVCRSFDFENDHRLRKMLRGDHERIEVAEFSLDEVKDVLASGGFVPRLFQSTQLELLRLPQNLSLFLDSNAAPGGVPTFGTVKQLFDRYWDMKLDLIKRRGAPSPEQWTKVIGCLCDEMTRTQQLSVRREKLDPFDSSYVNLMVSEGVLTLDGTRYGFGHESFFDYCFARTFIAEERSLSEFLTEGEQHLFRRAQVRQVLTYLRDEDRSRYCAELRSLLADGHIRAHVKDVALALLSSVPDPGEEEWGVLEPLFDSELDARAVGQPNQNRLATLAWQHIFVSHSWFHFLSRRGLVPSWLASGNDKLAGMGIDYVTFHQGHAGDTVAELLEPYVGKGRDWVQRLRYVMRWASHGKSRRFFDLLLRLVDDGTLDDTRDPIAASGTFGDMLHGLTDERPEWLPEAVTCWLRRQMALLRHQAETGVKPNWLQLLGSHEPGVARSLDAAKKTPQAFVHHLLPVILEITDIALPRSKNTLPRADVLRPTWPNTEHNSVGDACRSSLCIALEELARRAPESLRDVILELRKRDTYTSNYLLLSLYAAGAAHFAEEAAILLCDQPWRFECGFSNSKYCVATSLIREAVPQCSAVCMAKLEATVLSYVPEHERNSKGHHSRASFSLLSAIPIEYRSKVAQTRYRELERKFGEPDRPPHELRFHTVQSPIELSAARRMTNKNWLKAIRKYESEQVRYRGGLPSGGALELGGVLQQLVGIQPERFARLSLEFPPGTNPIYINSTLMGLKGAVLSAELKLDVCRKAYTELRYHCGLQVADLLGSLEVRLPDDAIDMLDWLATHHPDPEKELWSNEATNGKPCYGGEILNHGINTTRGRAAEAIRDLILRDAEYVFRFRPTLDRLACDASIAVRSCVASTLLAVAKYDAPLAMKLFFDLVTGDDRLLGTSYVEKFLHYSVQDHFGDVRPILERMVRSKEPNTSQAGARLAALSRLHHDDVTDLPEEAMAGNSSQRLGVAQVAASNIANSDCRRWCETHLLRLFDDESAEVRREAASCFGKLEGAPLESFEALIEAFCNSAAYQEDSFWLFHTLEQSSYQLPGLTCTVCDRFLTRFSDEAKDTRKHHAGAVDKVVDLVFRVYHQHQSDEWTPRCLNLIDQMCLNGFPQVRNAFIEYER